MHAERRGEPLARRQRPVVALEPGEGADAGASGAVDGSAMDCSGWKEPRPAPVAARASERVAVEQPGKVEHDLALRRWPRRGPGSAATPPMASSGVAMSTRSAPRVAVGPAAVRATTAGSATGLAAARRREHHAARLHARPAPGRVTPCAHPLPAHRLTAELPRSLRRGGPGPAGRRRRLVLRRHRRRLAVARLSSSFGLCALRSRPMAVCICSSSCAGGGTRRAARRRSARSRSRAARRSDARAPSRTPAGVSSTPFALSAGSTCCRISGVTLKSSDLTVPRLLRLEREGRQHVAVLRDVAAQRLGELPLAGR